MTRAAKLAILFIVLNFVDAALTAWAIAQGCGEVREANPVMAALLHAGPWAFIAVKTAVGAALAGYLWWRRPQSPVLWLGPTLVAGVLVWNVLRLNFG